MQIKLNLFHTNQPFIPSESASIHVLPRELLLNIFQMLNLKDKLFVRAVCRDWKVIANNSITHSQYLKEFNAIRSLSSLPARFSAWMPMPLHWGLYTKENVLKFSSIKEDIIAFHPPLCKQSSNFFSFTSSLPFSNRYVLLSQYGNTYFLTPQAENQLEFKISTDLQPLASHKLVATNIKDPTRKREFSLLKNLPPSLDNLSQSQLEDYQSQLESCQIEHCVPISEDNIAIITTAGRISFWDLLPEVPNCYKDFLIHPQSEVYKIGNQLIFDKGIVDLDNPSFLDHGFEFENEQIKTFQSSLCAYNGGKQELRYFIINSHGMLEKKWDFAISNLSEFLDQTKGPVSSWHIEDMNEKFILLTCLQSRAVNLIIMNTEGEIVQAPNTKLSFSKLCRYPTFAQLSGDILIYKNPEKQAVSFWHILAQKCIQEFDWTKSIYDLPLWLGNCLIQDIRLSDGKLTILLSTEHAPFSNQPSKFRLIQFDPQNTYQNGLSGIIKNIYSFVTGIYYAFPGKKQY